MMAALSAQVFPNGFRRRCSDLGTIILSPLPVYYTVTGIKVRAALFMSGTCARTLADLRTGSRPPPPHSKCLTVDCADAVIIKCRIWDLRRTFRRRMNELYNSKIKVRIIAVPICYIVVPVSS